MSFFSWNKFYTDSGWSYDLKEAFLHQIHGDPEFGEYFKSQPFSIKAMLSYRFSGLVDYMYKTQNNLPLTDPPIPEIEKAYTEIALFVATNADIWMGINP